MRRIVWLQSSVHTQSSSLSDFCPTLRGPLLFTPVDGQQCGHVAVKNDAEVAQVVEWLFHLFEHGINTDRLRFDAALDNSMLSEVLHRHGISTVDQPILITSDKTYLSVLHRFRRRARRHSCSSVVTAARRYQNQRVNLLNVAVSRARKHFITVGQHDVISQGRFTQHLTERSMIVPTSHVGSWR